MKTFFQILVLPIFLYGCNQKSPKEIAKADQDDWVHPLQNQISKTDTVSDNNDTSIIHADTASICGQLYTAFYKTDDMLSVCNQRGDTILKIADLQPNFEFEDFNGDGYKDIIVHYMSNVPGVQELLLFDKTHLTFNFIRDFSLFPDPSPIEGTALFYSYHRSGCADMNWDSDLFYLDKHKAIRIGNIAGYQCDNRDVKDGVYIHKITKGKKILFNKLPISTIWNYKDFKWGFIKEYWKKNYKLFLR